MIRSVIEREVPGAGRLSAVAVALFAAIRAGRALAAEP